MFCFQSVPPSSVSPLLNLMGLGHQQSLRGSQRQSPFCRGLDSNPVASSRCSNRVRLSASKTWHRSLLGSSRPAHCTVRALRVRSLLVVFQHLQSREVSAYLTGNRGAEGAGGDISFGSLLLLLTTGTSARRSRVVPQQGFAVTADEFHQWRRLA